MRQCGKRKNIELSNTPNNVLENELEIERKLS